MSASLVCLLLRQVLLMLTQLAWAAGPRGEYESEWAAITSIAAKLGIGTAETLRKWVRHAEIDAGACRGE